MLSITASKLWQEGTGGHFGTSAFVTESGNYSPLKACKHLCTSDTLTRTYPYFLVLAKRVQTVQMMPHAWVPKNLTTSCAERPGK